jgi:hypothetical protein
MRFINSVCAFVLCLYAAGAVLGQTVKQVDCNKGKSITAAVDNLKNTESYIIEVSGTCNENVVVRDFEGPSLVIQGTPTATVNGVAGTPAVLNSRTVRVSNITVNGALNPTPGPFTGNSGGLVLQFCRICTVSNVTVNHDRLGVLWLYSQGGFLNSTVNLAGTGTATAVANSSDVTVVDYQAVGNLSPLAFAGINVDAGSRVRLSYGTPKQIKYFTMGIRIANASSVEGGGFCPLPSPNTCLEVRENTYGMRITSAQGTVMSGVNFVDNKEGILVENGSIATMGPLVHIASSDGGGGAPGNGLTITHNSHTSIQSLAPLSGSANNITGNFRRGISIASGSSLQLNGLAASGQNNVTGNNTSDIACDATSLVTGTNTLPSAAVVSCLNQNPVPVPLP